jgi:hypothetical protein
VVSGWRYPLFFLILAVYLLAGVLFATLTPDWQAPDEPAHYNYIRFLALRSNFPELVARCYDQTYLERLKSQRFPPELSLDSVCYEFHQPPLYYLLATPIFLLSGGSLLALRLVSVMLGAGVVVLAFAISQRIFPDGPAIAYGTMAFVAFVPMHVAMLASVNNDALAELILAALLLLLVRRLVAGSRATKRSDISLGLLLGLGLITKTTVYIAIPLIAVTLYLTLIGEEQGDLGKPQLQRPRETQPFRLNLKRVDWLVLAKQGGLIYGLALAIALPWYVRNAALYGKFDILGLARHEAVVVGQPRTADYLAEVGWWAYLQDLVTTTFHSFWGQFGWMAVPMSERVYLVLTLLTLIAVGGLAGWRMDAISGKWGIENGGRSGENALSRASRNSAKPPLGTQYAIRCDRQCRALVLMALTMVVSVLGYLWYNLEFVQFQGRYLFPALIPLGLFFSLGLSVALSPHRAWWLVGGLVVALGWVLIAGLGSGNLNKWALLIVGLPLALVIGRAWMASRWSVPAWWPATLVYTSLALLALISPFWYVIPYLSP